MVASFRRPALHLNPILSAHLNCLLSPVPGAVGRSPGAPPQMAAEIQPQPLTRKPILLQRVEGSQEVVNMAVIVPKEEGVISVSEDRYGLLAARRSDRGLVGVETAPTGPVPSAGTGSWQSPSGPWAEGAGDTRLGSSFGSGRGRGRSRPALQVC